jgi:hypothetical protein
MARAQGKEVALGSVRAAGGDLTLSFSAPRRPLVRTEAIVPCVF